MEREHFSRQFDIELSEIREMFLEMGRNLEIMIANDMQIRSWRNGPSSLITR